MRDINTLYVCMYVSTINQQCQSTEGTIKRWKS